MCQRVKKKTFVRCIPSFIARQVLQTVMVTKLHGTWHNHRQMPIMLWSACYVNEIMCVIACKVGCPVLTDLVYVSFNRGRRDDRDIHQIKISK